jgi:uncharacterized membrane protein YedE/YeeE
MQFAAFTPGTALLGGVLIGLGASVYLLVNGRVAGISGLLSAVLPLETPGRRVRILFLVGLLLSGLVASLANPESIGASPRSLTVLAVAGSLVGFGTRLANGCTSGHGVCGISRGSAASVIATMTFVITGAVTATLALWFGSTP